MYYVSFSKGTSSADEIRLRRTADQVTDVLREGEYFDCLDANSHPSVHLMALKCLFELTRYSSGKAMHDASSIGAKVRRAGLEICVFMCICVLCVI